MTLVEQGGSYLGLHLSCTWVQDDFHSDPYSVKGQTLLGGREICGTRVREEKKYLFPLSPRVMNSSFIQQDRLL
jgi:hypothetical protein